MQAIRSRQAVLVLLVMVMVMLPACKKDFVTVAYNSLESMEIVYTTSLEVSGELYKTGAIGESQKRRIITSGKVFKEAFDVACVSLATFKEAQDAESRAEFLFAMTKALTSYDELLDLIQAIKGSPVPDSAVPNREYIDRVIGDG